MHEELLDEYDLMITGMWAIKRIVDRDWAHGCVYAAHDTLGHAARGEPLGTRFLNSHSPKREQKLLRDVAIQYRRLVAAETLAYDTSVYGEAPKRLVDSAASTFVDACNAFLRARHRRWQAEGRAEGFEYTEEDDFVPITAAAIKSPTATSCSEHHQSYGLPLLEPDEVLDEAPVSSDGGIVQVAV